MVSENLWLTSLPARDVAALTPHLHERVFAQGQTLYEAEEALDEVWFPMTGVVSLMTLIDGERAVETAAIGREGLVGAACGPMNGRAHTRAVAQIEGVAACCPAAVFSAAMADSEAMRQALASFTESLLAQVQQIAACNAQHPLDQRLARWLLTLHDKTGADRFSLTQADIAGMLGVRRATVSEVGSDLEQRDLIRRGRGWVEILDRPSLEGAACGCYGQMRRVAEDLGPPAG